MTILEKIKEECEKHECGECAFHGEYARCILYDYAPLNRLYFSIQPA